MIISQQLPGVGIHLIGKQGRYSFDSESLDQLAISPNRCHVQVASDPSKAGFQQIVNWQTALASQPLSADGVLLDSPNQSVLFHTADCPTVVLCDQTSQTAIAMHTGRAALTKLDGKNIIDTALVALDVRGLTTENITAYITGAICGKHFAHDQVPELAQPFLDTYGPEVFSDLNSYSLDLVAVIKQDLQDAGIVIENIQHDEVCTYETEGLASHRRDGAQRTTTNLVVVTTQ